MTVLTKTDHSDKPKKKTGQPVATTLGLVISVAIHAMIVLVVGTVVVFEGQIPTQFFEAQPSAVDNSPMEMEAPPLIEEDPLPSIPTQDDPMPTEAVQQASGVDEVSSDIIVSTAPSSTFSLSQSMNLAPAMPGVKSINSGQNSGQADARVARIFDREITASRFGAILDVSFSTHRTLPVAITEITKGFPDAILMLAPGCGMKSSDKATIVEGDLYTDAIEDEAEEKDDAERKYLGPKNAKGYYMGKFLEKLMKGNKDFNEAFRELWEDARRDSRAYVINVELSEKQRETGKVGGLISNTQDGFEFLSEKGCDVIYWMADFNDGLDNALFEDLIKDLRRKDIKVIVHDFDGHTGKDKKTRPLLQEMVDETEGEMIVTDISKKK